MTKTYTQCVSGDNLSLENIFGIIIIQLQLKKCGETLNVASNARRHTDFESYPSDRELSYDFALTIVKLILSNL